MQTTNELPSYILKLSRAGKRVAVGVTHHVVCAGALHVGDEIVEICGISVQGRTVDFLQKMLVSIALICHNCCACCGVIIII